MERLAAAPGRVGIGRFVDGRFGLDRLTAATAATPAAFEEIRRQRVERRHADRAEELRRVTDRASRK